MSYTIENLSPEDMEKILMGLEHLQDANLCAIKEDDTDCPKMAMKQHENFTETQQLLDTLREIYEKPHSDSVRALFEILRDTQEPPMQEPLAGAFANGYCSNEFSSVGPMYIEMPPSSAQRLLHIQKNFQEVHTTPGLIAPQKLSFHSSELGIKAILFRDEQFEEYPSDEWEPDFGKPKPIIDEESLPEVESYEVEFGYQDVSFVATEKHTGTTVKVYLNKSALEKIAAGPRLDVNNGLNSPRRPKM